MKSLGAAAILLVYTGLAFACPFSVASDRGSLPLSIPAEGGFCAALHNVTADRSLPAHPVPLAASGTSTASQTGNLLAWLLVHSIEHPPG